MDVKQFTSKLLKDIEVKATELFDRNFEQQGFFGEKWEQRKNDTDPDRGILIGRGSGRLRRGLKSAKRNNNTITWRFDAPYAKIHNEGGTIKSTQNVKAFSRVVKGKTQNVSAFTRCVDTSIPQRQFIGDHMKLRKVIEVLISKNVKKFNADFLKNNKK